MAKSSDVDTVMWRGECVEHSQTVEAHFDRLLE